MTKGDIISSRNVYFQISDCACPEKRMNLTGHMSSVIIRSPGFPNLYCPGKHCRILINSEKNEKRMKKDRLHPVLMILSNCSLNEYDSLKLGSMESGRLIFRSVFFLKKFSYDTTFPELKKRI